MNKDIVRAYTKLPITIYAVQFNGVNIDIIREFTGGKLSAFSRKNNKFYINTLEGMMQVEVNDYVVRGIVGEFYTVRQDIFELTYEDATNGNAQSST